MENDTPRNSHSENTNEMKLNARAMDDTHYTSLVSFFYQIEIVDSLEWIRIEYELMLEIFSF